MELLTASHLALYGLNSPRFVSELSALLVLAAGTASILPKAEILEARCLASKYSGALLLSLAAKNDILRPKCCLQNSYRCFFKELFLNSKIEEALARPKKAHHYLCCLLHVVFVYLCSFIIQKIQLCSMTFEGTLS